MSRDLEQELYEKICTDCESERRCHIECEHCDYYYEKLKELEEEEYEKEIAEEVQKRMQPILKLLSAMGFDKDSLADYMEEYCEIEEQMENAVRNEKGNENLIKDLKVSIFKEKWLTGHYKTDFEETKRELEQLKKELPNEPLEIVKKGNKYYCPHCQALIGKYNFCKYCGQGIITGDKIDYPDMVDVASELYPRKNYRLEIAKEKKDV